VTTENNNKDVSPNLATVVALAGETTLGLVRTILGEMALLVAANRHQYKELPLSR
jgi:hypothetical protein